MIAAGGNCIASRAPGTVRSFSKKIVMLWLPYTRLMVTHKATGDDGLLAVNLET